MGLTGVTVAFDLDGTLVDTAPDLIGALNAVLAGRGLAPQPLESARSLVGRGARALIDKGFRAAGATLEAPQEAELVREFLTVYRARIADQSRPFDGVQDALSALRAGGATLCVCTNKPTDLSILLLDRLALMENFAAVIGADKAPAPKPDPRHLWAAIKAAGGQVGRSAMVGDSATDSAAAAAAGVPMILVPFGYSEIPIDQIPADVRVSDFTALEAALRVLFERA